MTFAKSFCLILGVTTLLLSQISFAAVIHVPQDQPFIQAGIDAASDGDTVLVDDGIWTGPGNINLFFLGKQISVRSENGPQTSIIDCNYSGRGVLFEYGETNSSILQGFTIRNGNTTTDGGAIWCDYGSSPSIINCVFENNSAGRYGGTIRCANSSNPLIMNCVFENNCGEIGGGIYIFGSHPLILDCVFIGNSAPSGGGVIECAYGSSLTMFNCLLDNNYTGFNGGGISCFDESEVTIINSSILNNRSNLNGGGLFAANSSTISIFNSILWGNTAFGAGEVAYLSNGALLNLSYSNVEHGDSGIDGTGGYSVAEEYMMNSNPKFVSGPGGDYYLSQTASGQFSNSPCVDAGSDLAELICESFAGINLCMNNYTTRTDGVNDSGQVDMGYHYSPEIPECDYLGSRLVISQEDPFRAGDIFWLECHVCNNTDAPMRHVPTAILLGVYGNFWFWPSWSMDWDYLDMDFYPGLTTFYGLEPFTWPAVEGHANGLEFYAGILTPGMTNIIGDYGHVVFGYTDR